METHILCFCMTGEDEVLMRWAAKSLHKDQLTYMASLMSYHKTVVVKSELHLN